MIKAKTGKKQQILDSALMLFSEHGIEATSTASIAKAANVATGTLFHHFPNKKALVYQLYLATKHDLSQHLSSPVNEQSSLKELTQELWNNALTWAIKHPEKLRFFQLVSGSKLLSAQEKANAMAQELGMITRLISAGQASGIFAKHPIDLVALNCQGQFNGAGIFYIENPQHIDNQLYRQASFAMFWNALCPLG